MIRRRLIALFAIALALALVTGAGVVQRRHQAAAAYQVAVTAAMPQVNAAWTWVAEREVGQTVRQRAQLTHHLQAIDQALATVEALSPPPGGAAFHAELLAMLRALHDGFSMLHRTNGETQVLGAWGDDINAAFTDAAHSARRLDWSTLTVRP